MPEDKSTSGPDSSPADLAPDAAAAPKRIAIRARDAELSEALWQAIDRGTRKQDGAAIARAPRDQADIVIHMLSASDLADPRATAAEIVRDPAPVKYLLEPAGDAKMRARVAPALSELAKLSGTVVLGAEDDALSFSAEDTLQKQARTIARALKPESGERKTRKRKNKKEKKEKASKAAPSRAEKKQARRKNDAKPAKAGKKAAKRKDKKSKKDRKAKKKTTELPPKIAAKRAEKKSAKRAAKQERKGEKAEVQSALLTERARKKEAKLAAKAEAAAELAAKRGEKKSAKRAAKVELPPEISAKRAEKKSAKRATKGGRKKNKKTVAAPLDAAARAEKKAAKRAAKEGRKKSKKPELSAEERAAKKAAKKKDKPEAVELPPEIAAKRAEKKSAKRASKGERKKDKKPELSAEERAAKKAAKKAGKVETAELPPEIAAKRAEKKSAKGERKKDKKPELSAEERAAKKAAKKKDKPEAVELSPDLAAKRAEKKEAKRAAKEEKKKGKAEKPELSPEERAAKKSAKNKDKAALSPEERAAKKAAKKKGKSELSPEELAAKKAAKKKDKPELSPEERAAKKAAKKAEKKQRKQSGEPLIGPDGEIIDETRPLRLLLVGMDDALKSVLEGAFRDAGVETDAAKETKTDLAIYAFDGLSADEIAARAASLGGIKVRLRVFLERLSGEGLDEANRAIMRLASASGGTVLRLNARFRRFGADTLLTDGKPNEAGLELIAEAIVGTAAGHLPRRTFTRKPPMPAPDLVEARAAAAQPATFLPQLRLSGAPPKSIWASISVEQCEALADSKLLLTDEVMPDFRIPIDWDMELEENRAAKTLMSLDFLTGPLAYWYARANGNTSDRVTQIDAALKKRGSSPNALLLRATQIIADFIAKHPLETAEEAWTENATTERARVMFLFVLCCKAALKRKIKFSEGTCTAAFLHLLDMIEMLRGDDFYMPCSSDGVNQDCLTIGLGLGLRGLPYGNALLAEGLERFKTDQLDLGLTADGVWYTDSYSAHCGVLSALSTLIADFPVAEAAKSAPLAAIAKKMTAFAEAMLKSNGMPPVIDDSRQKSYADKLSGQRRTIAKATSGGKPAKTPLVKRIIDTYVFRDAQYFISHSSQVVEANSSLVVLHADPVSVARGDPGGVMLAFSHGERDLIVRAKPAEKVRSRGDQTPLYDPQLRNGYRVNGAGNAPPEPGGMKAARLVKSWRGTGWAAAKSIEDTYADASVTRVAIHLKTMHALIVVDELSPAAEFEQFWNVGADLVAPETSAAPLRFAAGDGALEMAFAPDAPVEIERGETGTCVRRRSAPGITAAILQWTDGSTPLSVAVERGEAGNWAIAAEGKGFKARIALAGNDLSCDLEAAPIS